MSVKCRTIKVGKRSNYKGVHFHTPMQKWRAYIVCNKKQYHLGYFFTEADAARAHNLAAAEMFGMFAQLNEVTQ